MSEYTKATKSARLVENEIKRLGILKPELAIILGTGASSVLNSMEVIKAIPFNDIPNIPLATYHKGELLICRTKSGRPIIILNGRLHYYEGYTSKELTYPIRILKVLGIKELYMTNASGGLNPHYNAGELVLIKDHINLMPDHPLRGPNEQKFGPRFPDMSDAYSAKLRTHIQERFAEISGRSMHEGIYVGLQGPSLETPAEYAFLRKIGGDMVGMSTVPEVIVANHCGMEVAVVSIVTNVCFPPQSITKTTLEEVVEIANQAMPRLTQLLSKVLD